jgi:phenylacetate-CoA ligase
MAQHERMSLDERLDRQWKQVTAILAHAERHSPYYRDRFRSLGLTAGDIRSWEDFRQLPILTKAIIREHGERLVCDGVPRSVLTRRRTSGSTGVALHFYTRDDEFQVKRAAAIYRDQWSGWRLGEWRACLWGLPDPRPAWSWRSWLRNHTLERALTLNTLFIDDEAIRLFVKQVRRYRPTLLFGHAHSLYLLARRWRHGDLPKYRFAGAVSTAMVLRDFERQSVQDTFGCQVFDRYGCEEVSLIASECEAHAGLHVNTDTLFMEPLQVAGREAPVVVTDLNNLAMPFIRYEIGDMAIEAGWPCPCGRTYPLLSRVAGRLADYLRRPDGVWVSGISLTDNFATLIPGIVQMQIIQDAPSHLVLRIVTDEQYHGESEYAVKEQVVERFGSLMRMTIEYVDRIEPDSSGKFRFSRCLLDESFGG